MTARSIITRFRAYQLGTAGASFSLFVDGTFTLLEAKSHWLSMNADTLRNLYRPGFKGLR